MENNYITLKCESCGATLNVNINDDIVQCEYCDTKIFLKSNKEFAYMMQKREDDIREKERREYERHEQERLENEKRVEERRKIENEKEQRDKDDKFREENKLKYLELQRQEKSDSFRRKGIASWAIVTLILLGIGIIGISKNGEESSGSVICLMLGIISALYFFLGFMINSDNEKEKREIAEGKIKLPTSIFEKNINYATVKSILSNAGFTNIQCIPLGDLTFGILKKPGTVDGIYIDDEEIENGGIRYYPDVQIVIKYHSSMFG